MTLHNTDERWGLPARVLHWAIALLIIGLLCVGFFMANFTSWLYSDMQQSTMLRVDLTQQHKSFGFVVFILACVRLVWRWFSPTHPGLPYGTPGWQRMAVHTTHYGLYLLMFMMPLSGWLMSSASPLNDEGAYPAQIKNMVFGLFEMPDPFVTGDRDWASFFHTIHEYSGYALAALLCLHIAGVAYHHLILRDTVLTRMLLFRFRS